MGMGVWASMVRQRRPPPTAANGGRRRNSKNSATVEFSQGVAVLGSSCAMVGNVRPSMAREATAIYGFWPGLNVLGVAGDASWRWCYAVCSVSGLSSILRGTLWLVFVPGPRHALLSRRASQSNPRYGRDTAMNLHPS
ncbi:hypothetical protein FNV43_RR20891 [Rhamnella rubrinervis]|uniref:Uncharacterized protein n=1 Tax=Rhamnella rubrinervis TaxID=2594499 RepID=A0A8K0E2A6_9ROSA|nr:hypothetical protein FNV43_RR20891 [Rhamnella rubrinervis]